MKDKWEEIIFSVGSETDIRWKIVDMLIKNQKHLKKENERIKKDLNILAKGINKNESDIK